MHSGLRIKGGKIKAMIMLNKRKILLKRKHPALARVHLYTAHTTVNSVLAKREYANKLPAIAIFSCD
jgi:hypothetical protein